MSNCMKSISFKFVILNQIFEYEPSFKEFKYFKELYII